MFSGSRVEGISDVDLRVGGEELGAYETRLHGV